MSEGVPTYIIEQALIVPQPWSEGGRINNWRNHVRHRVRSLWDTFTTEQKIAIAGDADETAGEEEWD